MREKQGVLLHHSQAEKKGVLFRLGQSEKRIREARCFVASGSGVDVVGSQHSQVVHLLLLARPLAAFLLWVEESVLPLCRCGLQENNADCNTD